MTRLFSWALLLIFSSSIYGDEAPLATKRVEAFLTENCVSCHGPKRQRGKVTLHDLLSKKGSTENSDRWQKVYEMMSSSQMPPEDEVQPSRSDRAAVLSWIRSYLESQGAAADWERKLLYPEYGNYVDHESLFDGSIDAMPFTPSRLWKRSPHLFDSKRLRGMGFGRGRYDRVHAKLVKAKQPFAIEDKSGVRDYADILFADSATLSTLLRNAELIVDQYLSGAMHERHVRIHGEIPEDQLPKDKKGKPIRPRHHRTEAEFASIVLCEDSPTDDEIDLALKKTFERVIERDPSDDDLTKYRQLLRECETEGGHVEALRMTLIAIAVSPQAVYRMELGQGPKDQHGRQKLHPADLAYAIAYALTDDPPDAKLLDAAKTNRLVTKDDVAREVTRLWDDAEIQKPRVLRFFREFFGYHRAPKVFKDDARFGGSYGRTGVAQLLVDDADTLVKHIVKADRNVLAELLTTDQFFVGHSGDNEFEKQKVAALAAFYDYLKDRPWKEWPYQTPKEEGAHVRTIHRMFAHPNGNVVKGWMKYLTQCAEKNITPMPWHNKREYIAAYGLDPKTFDFPSEQPFVIPVGRRAGLLSHPAWLIAHSLNLDNDPVRRGKWIRERLLAGTIPELPITVDARIPEAPERTLRQRFEVTREKECWRCHVKMNPLGFPFELYDDFGRFRTVETLHAKKKTAPVNASGFLRDLVEGSLRGEVQDGIELVQRLAKSTRVRQSFVRHAFRFWMGRNELLSDSKTLIAADQAYTESGGSFRALVLSLLTSDSFLYRKHVSSRTAQ